MRNGIVRLTLIAFGAHVLLGCWWHHAHAASPDRAQVAAEHNHDSHSPVDHDHDRDQCPDCAGVCQYLPVVRDGIDSTTTLAVLTFADQPANLTALLPTGFVDPLSGANRYGPSPRLHLLHCLLLI